MLESSLPTIACSPSSKHFDGSNYAEWKGDDVRVSGDGTATTTRRSGTARHSSPGGINLQIERHRSPGILDRRAHKAGQLVACLASRRTLATGLGGQAVRKPPSSVTPKSSRQSSAVRRPSIHREVDGRVTMSLKFRSYKYKAARSVSRASSRRAESPFALTSFVI